MRRFRLHRLHHLIAIAAVTLASRAAHAQTAADSQRAEQLFTEASALASAGRFDEACKKFEESQRLDSALGTQFNLALCFEKQGRLGSAWRNYQAVARIAHQTAKTGREEAARQKMTGLRRHVSHLVISARDSDVTVNVDGQDVERSEWGFYALDAGEHTITATAPAKTTFKTTITMATTSPDADGDERQLAIPALAVAVGETKLITVTKSTSSPRRTLGFAIGGIGLAGLGAGLVTGIVMLNDKSIAEDRCAVRCSDSSARAAVATGKVLVPVNVVAWSVGIVGVALGSVLIFTSGGNKASQSTATIAPLLAPGSGGASVVGTF